MTKAHELDGVIKQVIREREILAKIASIKAQINRADDNGFVDHMSVEDLWTDIRMLSEELWSLGYYNNIA